jgi:hypothetical protein
MLLACTFLTTVTVAQAQEASFDHLEGIQVVPSEGVDGLTDAQKQEQMQALEEQYQERLKAIEENHEKAMGGMQERAEGVEEKIQHRDAMVERRMQMDAELRQRHEALKQERIQYRQNMQDQMQGHKAQTKENMGEYRQERKEDRIENQQGIKEQIQMRRENIQDRRDMKQDHMKDPLESPKIQHDQIQDKKPFHMQKREGAQDGSVLDKRLNERRQIMEQKRAAGVRQQGQPGNNPQKQMYRASEQRKMAPQRVPQ